jgi:glycosyltransferase involved in cell wall biosynthesis
MLHFLGLGAQKAGTTWLHHWLAQHPQVGFPLGKEAHFWDRGELTDLAWYRDKMDLGSGGALRTGEITPAYSILGRDRVAEIRAEFPDLRLIFIIRNPIDRAWSSALMALERAQMTFEEASDQWFIDHFRSEGSLRRGDYEACLRTWRSVFPSEQLLVLRYESVRTEPRALLQRVAVHLSIDASFFSKPTDSQLTRRIFPKDVSASGWHCLRPPLRAVLEGLYRDKVRSLGTYLGVDLNWMPQAAHPVNRATTSGDDGGLSAPSRHEALAHKQSQVSTRVAICIPVLNRGDLALASFASLRTRLGDVEADIYLFDNGSDAATQAKLNLLGISAPHRLTRIRLPENRGLPYIFNLFCRMLEEPCAYTAYTPPDFVMIADADSYYKLAVRDLIRVLESDPSIGVVSGHDSVEHTSLADTQIWIGSREFRAREKTIERGQCLVMRRGDLMACYPLPHDTNLDLDWQLLRRHPRSMANRGRRILAVDGTVHLGLYESTWSSSGVPASRQELKEIDSALEACGLFNPGRQARRRAYLAANALPDPGLPHQAPEQVDHSRSPPRSMPSLTVPSPRPRQLIILGMHRSGTSAVTGVLGRLGLYVGQLHELLAADEANLAGYWERQDVLALNQTLLSRHLADAYQIGHLPAGAARSFNEPDLHSRAKAIVANLDMHGPWVMKDPRLCLTLPFWFSVLSAPVCVIVTRHPLEIAASLWRRDALPLPYALALWERYYVEALINSHGMPRVIVNYHDLVQRPAQTLAAVIDDLLRVGTLLPSGRVSAVDAVSPSLHRQHGGWTQEQELLCEHQVRLNAALLDGSALTLGPDLQVSRIARELLRRFPQAADLGHVTDR